jgi:hypothetical protein
LDLVSKLAQILMFSPSPFIKTVAWLVRAIKLQQALDEAETHLILFTIFLDDGAERSE